jgi:hypothetical protein
LTKQRSGSIAIVLPTDGSVLPNLPQKSTKKQSSSWATTSLNKVKKTGNFP